jgi:hypothetical protein
MPSMTASGVVATAEEEMALAMVVPTSRRRQGASRRKRVSVAGRVRKILQTHRATLRKKPAAKAANALHPFRVAIRVRD